VYCVSNPSVYFNCLFVSGNAINHDGIQLLGLIFDSAAFNAFRNVKSSYRMASTLFTTTSHCQITFTHSRFGS
jgi:hypothetical protein